MKRALLLCIASSVVLVVPVVVREAAAQGLTPDDYGTADTNYHYVSGEEFRQVNNNYQWRWYNDNFWVTDTVLPFWNLGTLRLPSGALVDGYTVIYDDSDAARDLEVALRRFWVGAFGATGSTQIGPTFTSTGTPGVRSTWVDLDPDATISYFNTVTLSTQSYLFTVVLGPTSDLRFRGIIVHWKRQISAAPATATFADVPLGAFGFQHVEALAASGITAGCGGGNFCPNQPLTRVQMAVFLAKALGLHWAP